VTDLTLIATLNYIVEWMRQNKKKMCVFYLFLHDYLIYGLFFHDYSNTWF